MPGTAVRLVTRFDLTSDEKRQAREMLPTMLARQTTTLAAETLIGRLIQFDPVGHDLSTWPTWPVPPPPPLLAAIRRNSSPADWLSALPLLTPAVSLD